MSVSVGRYACTIQAQGYTTEQIRCLMPLADPPMDDGTPLDVSVMIHGAAASCQSPAGCLIQASKNATYVLTAVSPTSVTQDTVLTMSGSNFPVDTPVVAFKDTVCTVTESTTTSITCTVQAGVGGRVPVYVRFGAGYAVASPSTLAFPTLTYTVIINSVDPTTGSAHGGRIITISGAGFSPKAHENRVFVGGKLAYVVSSTVQAVIAVTPTQNSTRDVVRGAERALAFAAASTQNFAACVGTLLGVPASNTTHINDNSSVATVPNAQALHREQTWRLVDADPSTVWRGAENVQTQHFVLDFGESVSVRGVRVIWAGTLRGATWSVRLAESCDAQARNVSAVYSFTNSTTGWDRIDTAELSRPETARYVVVIISAQTSIKSAMRIRDIVVVSDELGDVQQIGEFPWCMHARMSMLLVS
jgi:hypothetical protein